LPASRLFVGTGPSSYKKRIYRAAVSQRLRNTVLEYTKMFLQSLAHNSQWKQSAVVRPLLELRATVWTVAIWTMIPVEFSQAESLSEDISFLWSLFNDAVQTLSSVSPQVASSRSVVKAECGKRGRNGHWKKFREKNRRIFVSKSKKYRSSREN
jgi:hypothetical protein